MDELIKSRLIEKSVLFHGPIKRNKLKTFATAEVIKKMKRSQNKITQIRAELNIFGQLVLLSIQHDIDLELTRSFPLGPVPWALATADGMPVKTDKSKLLHYVESSIEPTTDRPKDDVVYVFDGNAMLQSLTNSPDTFEGVAETVFSQLPKATRIDFVTDTYYPQSIKSYERRRRGTTPTCLLSGAKTKTPREWKSFMSNEDNKTQLISLIFDQWSSNKYAPQLYGRSVFFVIREKCYSLTSEDGVEVKALSTILISRRGGYSNCPSLP